MALKGGRKIVVRDREFRWKISGGKYHKEYGAPRRLHLVVQEAAEKPGTPLCVYLDSLRWIEGNEYQYETFGPRHKASVTPKDTRAVIEAALDAGWDPTSRFVFSLCVHVPEMKLTDYRVLTLDGVRHGT
jgi:hypothetical protein